jgi:hypothetical protein
VTTVRRVAQVAAIVPTDSAQQRSEERFLVAERRRLQLESPSPQPVYAPPGNPFIIGRDLEPPPPPSAAATAAAAPTAAATGSTSAASWRMDPELAAAYAPAHAPAYAVSFCA